MRNRKSEMITLRLPPRLLARLDRLVEQRRSEMTVQDFIDDRPFPNRSSVLRELLDRSVDQTTAPAPQPLETK